MKGVSGCLTSEECLVRLSVSKKRAGPLRIKDKINLESSHMMQGGNCRCEQYSCE